jgi:hypothetical protein
MTFPIRGSAYAPGIADRPAISPDAETMSTAKLRKVPPRGTVRGTNRGAPPVATARKPAPASEKDAWAGVVTLLEIGFAIVRVVEIAILIA